MAEWIKRGLCSDVESFFASHNLSLQELVSPAPTAPELIDGIPAAAEVISDVIRNSPEKPVWIIGDYDADGITGTAILVKLLRFFGVEPQTIIPRRFSEGYGISGDMIANISNALIITVDNGITAVDQISAAKRAGNTVVVLDHHLPGEQLPPADVLVDPHIRPDRNGFVDYCGAGLAYKLAQYMCKDYPPSEKYGLFVDLVILAAIGTIADVMPMLGDNRVIIKSGLSMMRNKLELASPGIRYVVQLGGDNIDEDSIKFKVAPLLNAPGRLYDAGSTSTLKAMLCTERELASDYAKKLDGINEKRKELSAEWLEKSAEAGRTQQIKSNLLVVYCSGMPEGLTGLVAGKLVYDFKCPVFVFTNSRADDSVLKGSGRSYGGFDLSGVLPCVKEIALTCGGHAGAAGISVAANRFDEMRSVMQAFMDSQNVVIEDDSIYYDLDVDQATAIPTYEALKRYAPYGEGVPRPVLRFRNFTCSRNRTTGAHYRLLGHTGEHVRLFGSGLDAVAFHMFADYEELGTPDCVDLIGDINENVFNGRVNLQFKVEHMALVS